MRKVNPNATKGKLLEQRANSLQIDLTTVNEHPTQIYKTENVPKSVFERCFQLVKDNMKDFDEHSSLGWNDANKICEMKTSGGFYIVMEEGFASIRFEAEANHINCYLWEIQIDKKYVHQGFGTLLMDFVFYVCREAHCKKISLLVLRSNTFAKQFYDKLGFKENARLAQSDDVWIMEKKL
ncbi:hypothetical protein EIN_054500 [Entamoeba invadens IP1]|uniref:hypothetical protein n=1 Tax=Entamoeba invadens IP1 TaxID=370355 RepID=UPI0002C3F806|nr:hypothetical protein EIN_054500 [Entamoeba invadens IP1]ELP93165.1 hypothetical protein EIN_054500 [Entamoeba invadens IP1]|eukprot:XP_004259936.1 hypothetical protein EIN_054500 [Entamoeba invadens IP1]